MSEADRILGFKGLGLSYITPDGNPAWMPWDCIQSERVPVVGLEELKKWVKKNKWREDEVDWGLEMIVAEDLLSWAEKCSKGETKE